MLKNGYTVQSLGSSLGVAERTVYRWRSATEVPRYVSLSLEALEHRDSERRPASAAPDRDRRATSRGA